MSSIPNYSVKLKIQLLDDNSKEIFKVMNEDAYLIRKGNQILTRKNQSEIEINEETTLFHLQKSFKTKLLQISVIQNNNNFQTIESIENLDIKLWTHLNKENSYENNKNGNYILRENDIIRFGNLKYLVHKINIVSKEKNKDKDKEEKDKEEKDMIFLPIPKINDYYKSPLCNSYELCLCICKKKYLHYHCFENKFFTKPKENKQKTVKSYYLDNFYCKKCYCTYPFVFMVSELNKQFNILNYDTPKNENYIILESLGHRNENNAIKKSVHLILLTDEPVKIGKKDNNDLIIDDNSIKDEHAEIIFDKNNEQIILKNLNNNETDVLLRNKLILNENKIHLKTKNSKIEVDLITN